MSGTRAPRPSGIRAPRRGGAAWRYFGDTRNFLISPQLLLLQVAHPVVGAGVEQHSNFRAEPWQRLWRTVSSLSTVIYGGQAAATAEADRIRAMHEHLKGVDDQGRRYHALNPEAYHWVHATLVRGGYDGHRIFGKGLSAADTEAYYQEMRDVGRVWGLRDHHLPPDWAAFCAYYDEMVRERLELNQSVRDVLDELARPRKPPVRWIPAPLWRPVGALSAHYALLVNVGTLPPVLRERLGLTWTPRQERALRRVTRFVRVAMAVVPPPLRIALTMAVAYWNTHKPGTDRRARRPLGAA
ncbi:oxygenase MpaB family protein [Streptomyces sp. NPDC055243]|uniref:oxygenase MpaB family protein n=1 Tax=Streptomyces sp. NPDC055243 TaxID=3365720 RepID=UPI0037D47CB4